MSTSTSTTSLLLILLTLTLIHAQQQTSETAGLTRDFCATSTDCQSPRSCYLLNNATLLPSDTSCPEFDACRCVPPTYTQCTTSEDCQSDESCARTVLFPFVCTSSAHVQTFENRVVTIENSPSNPLVPFCAPPSTPVTGDNIRQNGLVLDPCLPGSCASGLSCVVQQPDSAFQCCGEGECVCHAPDNRPICDDSSDCNTGEVCGVGPTLPKQCYSRRWMRTNRPALWRRLTVLAAPTPDSDAKNPPPSDGGDITPTPSPEISPASDGDGDDNDGEGEEEEAVCVDAEALSHLPMDQLVFKKHRLGRVLCDFNGSCATPGHIVMYHNSAMMMKSYCEMAGCVEKVIRVNSVKYRRALLTESNTQHLSYTALAARFATLTEERVLVAAVRLGL